MSDRHPQKPRVVDIPHLENVVVLHSTIDDLRTANADLTTLIETMQGRLADLETESEIYRAELQRLEHERAGDAEPPAHLTAELEQLRNQLAERDQAAATVAARCDHLEETLRALQERYTALCAAHAEELAAWHDTAAQREAEMVGARDNVARLLEEEQSKVIELQQQVDTVTATLCGAEAKSADAAHEVMRLEQEVAAAREERERERAVYEATARQRETEFQGVTDALRREHTGTLEQRDAQVTELTVQLEALQRSAAAQQEELSTQAGVQEHLWQQLRTVSAELDRARGREEHLQAATAEHQQECTRTIASLSERLSSTTEALAQERGQLSNRVDELSANVLALEGERDSLRHELAKHTEAPAAAVAPEVERERNELRLQVEKLSAVIRQTGCEREEQRAHAQQAQHGLAARIDELTNERETLQLRLAEQETLAAQLERECERLRRDRTPSDDTRRLKADVTRLEGKLEDIDRQRSDAVHNHSAAVAGYMVELNQRSEALHARELELQRITEELTLTRQACEDALAQVSSERHERTELERQLSELRRVATTAAARPGTEAGKRAAAPPQSPAPPKPQTRAPPAATVPKQERRPAPARSLASEPITVIHIDEHKEIREHIRSVVSQLTTARYLNTLDVDKAKTAGTQVLAVNLINRLHDPLAAIAAAITADAVCQNIFAYCAEGTFGFALGDAWFFTHPLDSDACVAWLMESRGTAQRLLVASDNMDMTSSLRAALTRIRCSTSVALDLRQVLDLVPMIQPEVVLVDLSLPRAEGLRLVNRLRSDPKTRELPLGILLPETAKIAEFRQNAARAARESPITPDQLAEAFRQRLGIPVPGGDAVKAAAVAQAS